MTNTKDLILKNVTPEIDDKVYLLCKVEKTSTGYNVFLSYDFPIVWLNDKYKNQYGNSSDFTVKDIQSSNKDFVLLSAGAFLWHKDKMILLKRDAKAPSYAGAIVEAAGRCGELPSLTMIKELNEEILITSLQSDNSVVLALLDDEKNRDDIVNIKEKQIESKGIELSIIELKLEEFYPEEMKQNTVNVFIDNVFIEKIDGYSFYDMQDNTLEIRKSFKLNDEINLDLIFDGEPFNRQIFIKDLNELKNEFTSNTIKHVCQNLKNKNKLK